MTFANFMTGLSRQMVLPLSATSPSQVSSRPEDVLCGDHNHNDFVQPERIKCFKHFYINEVQEHMADLFPKTIAYNRFTELERTVVVPFILFAKRCCMGKCTGISFVDSTLLRVCRNQRIHMHKVFKGIAQRGQCSIGWFYGFKLHLICNEMGELLSFMVTPGNVDDREPLKNKTFVEHLFGKLAGDKIFLRKGPS